MVFFGLVLRCLLRGEASLLDWCCIRLLLSRQQCFRQNNDVFVNENKLIDVKAMMFLSMLLPDPIFVLLLAGVAYCYVAWYAAGASLLWADVGKV